MRALNIVKSVVIKYHIIQRFKMFIVFTGTHSTGKTTILDELKKIYPDFKYHNSVTRYAESKGIKINKEVSDSGQQSMMDIYELYEKSNLLSGNNIMDRCLIDTLGYSMYFYSKGLVSYSTLQRVKEMLILRLTKYSKVFYFPIEFDNILDGTRVDDEEFRKTVDKNIRDILKINNIDYIIVQGSIEDRLNIIIKHI